LSGMVITSGDRLVDVTFALVSNKVMRAVGAEGERRSVVE